MGHCSELDLVMATVADLALRYGPLCGMRPYSKICDDSSTMDHSAGFGYAQLAIVQDLVKRMGRSKEFG
jgi:hypothetical protein